MFSNSIASRYLICCSRQQICSCSYRSSTKACISFADLKPLYSNFKIHIKNYCSTLTPILHTSIYTFMCYFAETFHRHPYCYFKGHRTNFILTVHAEQLSTNFYVLIRIVYTFLCYSFGHVQEHPPNHLHENWRVFKRDFVS